jgi:hypothetical protein
MDLKLNQNWSEIVQVNGTERKSELQQTQSQRR